MSERMASSEFETLLGETKEVKARILHHEWPKQPEWGKLQALEVLCKIEGIYGEIQASNRRESGLESGSSVGICNIRKLMTDFYYNFATTVHVPVDVCASIRSVWN